MPFSPRLPRRARSTLAPEMLLKKRRRARMFRLWLGALLLILVLPPLIFQWSLARRNNFVFASIPLLTPLKKSDRLLIISPHCDDETLGAGGTIAEARKIGAQVRVIFLTNGDGSRSTRTIFQAQEWKDKIRKRKAQNGDASNLFQRIAAMRQRESLAACAKLGVAKKDVIFLGFPDGGMRALWENNWSSKTPYFSPYTQTSRAPYSNAFTPRAEYSGAQVARDLEKIFGEFKPTLVLTTHPEDTHSDHWAAYAFASATLEKLRLDASLSTQIWAAKTRLLGFVVHHGIWPTPNGYQPRAHLWPPASLVKTQTQWRFELLSPSAENDKKSALECYVSQLATTPRYLRAFVRRNELFGVLEKTDRATDPPSDSMWSEAWRAADIQSLQIVNTKNGAEQSPSGVLRLQTKLAGAPSSRARYEYSIHVISPEGIKVWKIDARRNGEKMQANLTNLDPSLPRRSTLQASLIADGIIVDLPREFFEKSSAQIISQSAILISAATFLGATRLDQTATRIMTFGGNIESPGDSGY